MTRKEKPPEPGKTHTLWGSIRTEAFWKNLSPKDKKALRIFLDLQSEFQAKRSSLRTSEVIREIISVTSYDTKVLLETGGKRKFANLEKLVELARSFDRRGFPLKELLVHLKGLTVKEVREAEAQVDKVDGERVQLMTVHKAKGLEFPICFVADFDTRGRSDASTFNFSPHWGIGFKGDFIHLKNKEEDQLARHEEARRLLYVATTRAKERLILSSAPSSKQKDSFLGKLLDYLECESGDTGVFRGVQVGKIKESTKKNQGLLSLMDDPVLLKAISDKKKIESPLKEVADLSGLEKIYKNVSEWKFPKFEVIDRSVSALLDFPEIKLSEDDSEEPDGDSEVSMAATDYGTFFHSLLEIWDVSHVGGEEYEHIMESMPHSIPAASRERLLKELHLFSLSDLLNDLKTARTIERELEFDWQVKNARRIRGVIDLLFQSSEGVWNLIDYKTNRVDSDADIESKMELYRLQLEVYGASIMKGLNLKQLICGLYFSGVGRTVSWEMSAKDLPVINKKIVKKLQEVS
jgi:ATP-dependent helicase/nuclease subunit A